MVVGYEPVNLTDEYSLEVGRRYTFQNTSPGETAVAWIDVREADAAETEDMFAFRPRERPVTLLQRDELVFYCRSPDPETYVDISLIEQS